MFSLSMYKIGQTGTNIKGRETRDPGNVFTVF